MEKVMAHREAFTENDIVAYKNKQRQICFLKLSSFYKLKLTDHILSSYYSSRAAG